VDIISQRAVHPAPGGGSFIAVGDLTDTPSASTGPLGGAKAAGFGLVTKVDDRRWTNAVDSNDGGTKAFAWGPWHAGYGLGTCGVDARAKTSWAVINHGGDFNVGYFDDRWPDAICREGAGRGLGNPALGPN